MEALSLLFTMILFGSTAILAVRTTQQWRIEQSRELYDLQFPHDMQADEVSRFMRSLSALVPGANRKLLGHEAAIFEVWATRDGISHRLHLPGRLAKPIITQLRATVPGVRVAPVPGGSSSIVKLRGAVELGLTGSLAPLNVPDPVAITTAILASLQPLGREEAAVMQWTLVPCSMRDPARPRTPGVIVPRLPWWAQAAFNLMRPKELTTDEISAMKTKLAEPVFAGVCRVGATARSTARVRQIMRQVSAPLNIASNHPARFVRQPAPSWLAARRLERAAVPVLTFPAYINAAELTALTAWPIGAPALPGLIIGSSRQLPPSPAIGTKGHVIGEANFPGAERPVAIGIADSLKHIHTIGPTGSGKSTLLINMIVQDMASGSGVAVFDPKGDLIQDLLARIPKNRLDDVVLLDPTDPDSCIGLNLLDNRHDGSREVVVDQVVGVFKRLFAAFWGPRTDDVLRSCLLTLMHHEGTTLCDVPLLLQDSAFRMRMISKVDDPVGLGQFWEFYEALRDNERAKVVGPIMNKLRTLLLRQSVRDIFGQSTSSISMREVLAQRKILLVSLPKGQLGEDTSALLGSLLVMNLWQAVQGRGTMLATKRTPFFCYIDEFQDYLNLPSGIAEILAQARGFGFGLILAHQHLGQLNSEVKEAVLANSRSKIVFQTTASDAKALAVEFAPYLTATDLQNLEPYQAMAIISAANLKIPPVSIATLPAPKPTSDPREAKRASLARYGRSRLEVETALRDRLGAEYGVGNIGRTGK